MACPHITQSSIHFKWSRKLTPALTVASGTEVTFDLRDGGNNQITPENQATILGSLDFDSMDPGFGPVAVEGAEPGDVLRGRPWVRSPHFVTPRGAQPYADRGQEYAVMGLDADLREAARKALRSAIEWLGAEKGLERSEAYMLCSVVADLKIVQAVDMPHYGVVCTIPLGIFVDE
ncbi:hypothetical protein LLEC1_04543 [Akanthomyces lecanii]|uniref:Acetamidase n=1 Tax=Cordyceps confragosa TaxID=2714763 RepID=A0A179I6G5_CORDF|nr:hypothetical protein LLEC1_04543 [Akanthomyces lecanii]